MEAATEMYSKDDVDRWYGELNGLLREVNIKHMSMCDRQCTLTVVTKKITIQSILLDTWRYVFPRSDFKDPY